MEMETVKNSFNIKIPKMKTKFSPMKMIIDLFMKKT